MISLPDYDPNLNDYKTPRAQFNFATKGVYEPGSVLKIFNAALGLESGKVKLADRFDATKPLKLRYNTIKDYRGENRWLTLQEVLIYSSNIGSAQIALKVGKKEQQNFLKNLGFFEPIQGIEVAERGYPLVPDAGEKKQRPPSVTVMAFQLPRCIWSALLQVSSTAAFIMNRRF